MFSTSLALLGTAFQGRERGTAFGVWGAITGLAVAIGPVVGGALTTGLSWRWIFLVNVPIGIVAVVLDADPGAGVAPAGRHRARPDRRRSPSPARWARSSTRSSRADSKGWGSTLIVACLVGAGVC